MRNGCFSHPSFIVFLWVPCVCRYACCDASGEHHRHSVEWDCHNKYLSFLLHRTCLPSWERESTTHSAFSMLAIQNQGDGAWLWWFFVLAVAIIYWHKRKHKHVLYHHCTMYGIHPVTKCSAQPPLEASSNSTQMASGKIKLATEFS